MICITYKSLLCTRFHSASRICFVYCKYTVVHLQNQYLSRKKLLILPQILGTAQNYHLWTGSAWIYMVHTVDWMVQENLKIYKLQLHQASFRRNLLFLLSPPLCHLFSLTETLQKSNIILENHHTSVIGTKLKNHMKRARPACRYEHKMREHLLGPSLNRYQIA